MIALFRSKAGQDMQAYFKGVMSVKFVMIDPFTNAVEDSRLGNNFRVCVGTIAENVETGNIKRRANFRPCRKAMLRPIMLYELLPTTLRNLLADSALEIL